MRRKQYVKITAILMAAGLLLLSGCGSLTKITELTAGYRLSEAIKEQHKEEMREALEDHGNVDRLPYLSGESSDEDNRERNPLRLGFEYSISRDMIKMLLDAGADVNAYDADGYPLIFYSVRTDNDRLFCMLADYGPDLTLKNKEGTDILEYYIMERSQTGEFYPRREMVKLLIDHGAPVTKQTMECAKRYGDYYILDLLYPQTKNCFTELQKQYLEGNAKKANWILERQEELSETDIAIAVIYGDRETIKILNKRQIDYSKIKPEERPLLELAAWNQNLETVSAMLENDRTLVRFNKTAMTTEMQYNDDAKLLEYLCENGWLDSAEYVTEGELADYLLEGALESVSYLLGQGYDISRGTTEGADLLMTAIEAEDSEMTKLLLDYGADPNIDIIENSGEPVWIYACEKGNTDILNLFLEYGADLKQYGGKAMRQAIEYCNLDVIELLAKKGVKITEDLYQFSQDDISSDHVREYVKQLYEQQHG